MRRCFLLILTLLLAGCNVPSDDAPGFSTTTSTTTTTTSPTGMPPPTPTSPPTPTHPAPDDGRVAPTVPVTFRFTAPGHDEMILRFPLFWGTELRPSVNMAKRQDAFEATVELPVGALVRYWYSVPTLDHEHREQFAPGFEVSRMLVIGSARHVEDEVYALAPADVARPARLEGRVVDRVTGAPLLEAFVVADGVMTSTMDGYYSVAVRDRPMDVTVFTLDGSHRAITLSASPGTLDVAMDPARPARVRIEANAVLPPHHELRIFATAAQVSSHFAYANRFITETYLVLEGGSVELDLHEGQWVDYVYSVGNVFQSFERDESGRRVFRSLVAKDGLVVRDDVGPLLGARATWFNVTVPAATSPSDVVGMRDIDVGVLAMHRVDDTRWTLAMGDTPERARYRYIKTWSGVGDEAGPPRNVTAPRLDDVVEAWRFERAPALDSRPAVPAVKNAFNVTVTLPDWYSAPHALALDPWLADIARRGFHGVVLNQVWGYAAVEPLPVMARDKPMTLYMPAHEQLRATRLAHDLGLDVTLETQMVGAEAYLGAPKEFDAAWWSAWLREAERFNLQQARLAQATGVDSLQVLARAPGFGVAPDAVATYDEGMRRIIAAMRGVYAGRLSIVFDEFGPTGLQHSRDVDAITQVTYDAALSPDATQAEVDAWAAGVMDSRYAAQADASGKPLHLKFGVTSVDGALAGRKVPEADGPHTPQHESYALDVEEQRMLYEAFFKAANDRSWVGEMNVWVYGPTDAPGTRDVDVRGKPAGDLAASWARAITARRAAG